MAPNATTSPGREAWSVRSQLAVFIACHIPFRFGFPSGILGALLAGWPETGTHASNRAPANKYITRPLSGVRIKSFFSKSKPLPTNNHCRGPAAQRVISDSAHGVKRAAANQL